MSSYQEQIKKQFGQSLKENTYVKINEEMAQEKGDHLSDDEKTLLSRLNFDPDVKVLIGARVGFRCCYPGCGQVTLGPNGEESFAILGEAAHIYGATKTKGSSRIPRPAPPTMSENDIKSFKNGIWLCRHHHRLIDVIWNESTHTPSELAEWKKNAEEEQSNLLIEKEHEVIRKFFDRLPNLICNNRIEPSSFSKREWCLILFVDSFNQAWCPDINITNYIDWLNDNAIRTKDAGVELNWRGYWWFEDEEKIFNKLAGIIRVNKEEASFSKGKYFDDLIYDLEKIDEDYSKLMIDEIKVKY